MCIRDRNNTLLVCLGSLAIIWQSCTSRGNNPGYEYAPNMYISKTPEPYSQLEEGWAYNPKGMSSRLPVKGTIAKGQIDYQYPHPNSLKGYEAAAAFTSEMPKTQENVLRGKELYEIYCWHCHGKGGNNDGPVVKEGYIGVPWEGYTSDYIKELPDGKIYHTITHGKGLMGSHAHMLTPSERWKVIYYVRSLSMGDEFVYEQTKNQNK